jgi:hypothetical protein
VGYTIYHALFIGDPEVQRRALVLTAYMAVWLLSDTSSWAGDLYVTLAARALVFHDGALWCGEASCYWFFSDWGGSDTFLSV